MHTNDDALLHTVCFRLFLPRLFLPVFVRYRQSWDKETPPSGQIRLDRLPPQRQYCGQHAQQQRHVAGEGALSRGGGRLSSAAVLDIAGRSLMGESEGECSVCVCVCARVCVCVTERESGRVGESGRERERGRDRGQSNHDLYSNSSVIGPELTFAPPQPSSCLGT